MTNIGKNLEEQTHLEKFLSPGNWALHIVFHYYKKISELLLIAFEFEYQIYLVKIICVIIVEESKPQPCECPEIRGNHAVGAGISVYFLQQILNGFLHALETANLSSYHQSHFSLFGTGQRLGSEVQPKPTGGDGKVNSGV